MSLGGEVECLYGRVRGALRFLEGEGHEYDAKAGNGGLGESDAKHVRRPFRSVLLGLEGLGCVALLLGGLVVAVGLFKRSGNALSVALERGGRYWAIAATWGLLGWGVCIGATGVVTLWIGANLRPQ